MSTVTTAMPKRRGRPPKSRATEPEAEPPTPLRRGRPPKRGIHAPEPDADNEPEPRTRPKRLASKPASDLEAPEQTESQNRQDRATARKKTKRNIESVKKDQDQDKDSASAQQTVSLKKTKKPHRRGRGKNKKTSREENDTTKVAKENAGVVLAAGSGTQILINDGAGVDILQDGQVSMQMADDYLNSSDSDNELALREDDAPNPTVEDACRTDGGHDVDDVHDEYVDEEIRTENTLHDDNEFTLSDQSLIEEIADEDKACGRTGIGDMSVHQLAAFLVKRGQSGEGTRDISPVPMLEDEELDSVFDNANEEVISRGTFAPDHMDAVDAFLDGDRDIDAVTDCSKNDADDGRNKEEKTGLPAAIRSPGTVVVPSSTPKLEHMAVYNHGTVVDFWLYLHSLELKDLELTQVQQRALEHVAPKTWSPFANVHDVQLDYSSPTAKKKPAPLKRPFTGDKAPEPPGHYIWRMFFTKSKEQEGAVVHRIRQVLLLLAWSRFRREVPKWKENVLEGGDSISPIRRSKDIDDVLSILRKDRNATAWQKRYRDLKVEAQWGAMYKDIVPPSMSALPSIEVPSSTSIFIPKEGFEELGVGLDRDAQDVGFLAGEFGEGGVLLLAIATPLVQMLEHGEGLGLLKSNGVTEALNHGYNVGIEQHALEYGVTEVAKSVVDGMVDRLNECMLGQKG